MELQVWIAFVAASTALLLIPGPTVLLVLSYVISRGRAVALATVAGVALGDFFAMTASLAGLGALVLASSTLFTVLKWIGAAYLVYLGVKLFRSASGVSLGDLEAVGGTAPSKVFAHAAAVTALNPKSIVFFIAFVPQFIVVDRALFPQFAILIVTFVGLAAVNALAYALLAERLRTRIASPSTLAWFARFGGSALVAMGLATVAFRRVQQRATELFRSSVIGLSKVVTVGQVSVLMPGHHMDQTGLETKCAVSLPISGRKFRLRACCCNRKTVW